MQIIKDKAEFKKEVLDEKEQTVLVDFFAEWCGPCKMMLPVLEAFSSNNKNVKIVKVDVDASQELAMEYNVMSIPTLYVFKEGKAVKQMMGFQNEQALESATR